MYVYILRNSVTRVVFKVGICSNPRYLDKLESYARSGLGGTAFLRVAILDTWAAGGVVEKELLETTEAQTLLAQMRTLHNLPKSPRWTYRVFDHKMTPADWIRTNGTNTQS